MSKVTPAAETLSSAIFQFLLNELPGDSPAKTNGKIRRKLSRTKVGPYDQGQVDQLRALHDALSAEVGKMHRSQYYRGTPGRMAAPENFDHSALVRDFDARFPAIGEPDLARLVAAAVYFYYLR